MDDERQEGRVPCARAAVTPQQHARELIPLPQLPPPGTPVHLQKAPVALAHGKLLQKVERFISVSNVAMILWSVEIKCLNWQSLEHALGSSSF